MLTLTFLGVGAAFAKRNFQSNALVEAWSKSSRDQRRPDDTLLVDFGTTGPLALHQLKDKPEFAYLNGGHVVHYPVIRKIIITHQHSDHIGGLEELAGMNTHCFVNPETAEGHKAQLIATAEILSNLWEHSLKGGLGTLSGRRTQLTDYFDVLELSTAGRGRLDRFRLLDRYECTLFPTDHIHVEEKYDWPSYGLLFRDLSTGQTVVYSGDTRFDPHDLGEKMAAATLNFHEVQLEDRPFTVHATLSELRTLPEEVRQKTYLYHYGDCWDHEQYAFVARDFAGFAQPHHRYTLFP